MESKHILAEYQHNKYLEHKQLRLCVQSCGRMAKAGRLKCEVCLRKARARWKVLHPMFCVECERPIKSEERSAGIRLHKLCAEKQQARRYPHQHRSAALAYQRRHKKLGLCLSCPQKAFKANLCRKHYRTEQERYQEREAREQGRGLWGKSR